MSVEIPPEFKVDDYYTSSELSQIMNVSEEAVIRQLQLGRLKGTFIDMDG
ncbi:hypothetical protein J3D43_005991 [Paenibacillus xylanexedens]|nr:hypothetical protein [Paenibacillus xylanexedens]MCP1427475.1 hypothetical protein [Paenibacillus xylanexedens]